MKKNMTKCVIGLLFICVLFLSCNFAGNDGCLQKNENKNSWGELVIYNQTSSGISDINYCGERFVMWYNSYSGTSFIGEGKKLVQNILMKKQDMCFLRFILKETTV